MKTNKLFNLMIFSYVLGAIFMFVQCTYNLSGMLASFVGLVLFVVMFFVASVYSTHK